MERITQQDAIEGATEFLKLREIPEELAGKPNPMWTKVLERAKQIAHERAAELVGMRVGKDGTIRPNPDAKWSITETTRDSLRELVEKSIADGWTNTQLQHEIITSYNFSPARALNVSRTERAFARSHGTHEAAKTTGMAFKDWLPDDSACEEVCLPNAAQGRIPIDEDFDSGDECSPGHPSCRCANGYYETANGD